MFLNVIVSIVACYITFNICIYTLKKNVEIPESNITLLRSHFIFNILYLTLFFNTPVDNVELIRRYCWSFLLYLDENQRKRYLSVILL